MENDVQTNDVDLDLRDPRVYEIGYLLNPNIQEADVEGEVDALRKMVTDNGGLPISEGKPELIDLEYIMDVVINNERNSFAKGYFGWIKFDVTPEKVEAIKKALDGNTSLLRFLLVKTIRESVVARPSFVASKAPSKEASSSDETKTAPLDEEKLDKQIDDLVVEEEKTSESSE